MQTFSKFKNDFYSKVPDLSVFDCQDFNILKVVLDGLKVNYAGKGNYRTYMFYPEFAYASYLNIKRLKSKDRQIEFNRLKKFSGRKQLIIDPGRFKSDDSNKIVSSYFTSFYSLLDSYTSVCDFAKHEELFDFVSPKLSAELQFEPLTKEEKDLRKALVLTFKKIELLRVFNSTELLNIKIAIDLFFKKYREWDRIIKVLGPERALFVCHYHKEGAMLAFKRNKIPTIEFQHGLIAPEDIFYMFPTAVKAIKARALFADEIWVYGEFWKKRLLEGAEYEASQIKVFGYYMHENKRIPELIQNKLSLAKGDKKIILVTTQDKHPREMKEYVLFLAKDLKEKAQPYSIWIKPHPAEKKGAFDEIARLDNVLVTEENLDYLFQYADIMLSIYSTTLYDACRFNIPAFALYADSCADYVNSIVESGVASLLQPNQNPVDLLSSAVKSIDSGYYFNPCDLTMLKTLC